MKPRPLIWKRDRAFNSETYTAGRLNRYGGNLPIMQFRNGARRTAC